ncbi:MAG: sugar phosphate isomerase/epimerase [Eubacteriales bacterium]
MSIGVSTSCYYPLETEQALLKIASLGVKTCEIFFNSFSEIKSVFLKEICQICDANGIRVPSIHPFFSFGEPYLLFSEYERRFYDSLEFYKKYFEAANILSAKILVMHGGKSSNLVSDELFFERFAILAEKGREQGIVVAQENVLNFRSQSPNLLTKMKEFIGNDFKIVLDLKQAARAGYSAFEFIESMTVSIAHIHISDLSIQQDCMPPGEGDFDFVRLLAEMKAIGYTGDYIIELYRHNFKDESQIADAMHYMEHLERIL